MTLLYLRINGESGGDGHDEFGTAVSPAAAEVVVLRAVVVQAQKQDDR